MNKLNKFCDLLLKAGKHARLDRLHSCYKYNKELKNCISMKIINFIYKIVKNKNNFDFIF